MVDLIWISNVLFCDLWKNVAKNFARMCFLAECVFELGLLNSSSLGSINSNIVEIMWHLGTFLSYEGVFYLICILRWNFDACKWTSVKVFMNSHERTTSPWFSHCGVSVGLESKIA